MLIVKKIAVFAFSICFVLLFSCENENEVIFQDKGLLEFSFTATTGSNLRTQNSAASYLLVSIADTNGKSVVSRQKIKLYSFGESILSEPISLNIGNYFLTEYLVLDDQESVIYATPKKEAKLDYLVEFPLPIEFVITKDETAQITPEVISVGEINPTDFGYTTFAFEVVNTFDFLLSVFTYDTVSNNFELTHSKLQIKCDDKMLFDNLISDSTNLIKLADEYSAYELIVTKEGYTTFQDEFTASELKVFSDEPLTVKLFSGVNIENDLAAYYPLNGNAKDEGEFHYDGIIHEAVASRDRFAKEASAYAFDGGNDKITMGDVLDFQANDFTISLWVNVNEFKGKIPDTNSYGSWIVSKGITIFGTPQRAGYAINAYKSTEGKNYFQFFLGNQQEQIFMIEKDGFSEAEWYHIVVSKHGLKQKLFVNGELVADAEISDEFNVNTNIPLVFGSMDKLGHDAKGTTYLQGSLDEVRFYARALSVQEIQYLSIN